MAKFQDFEAKLNEINAAVVAIADTVGEIDGDVTFLKEALTHVSDGLTSAEEADILGRLEALSTRVAGVKTAVDAVNSRTPTPAPVDPPVDPVFPN